MGKSAKIARLRQDKFYKLAREAGYRSRAAFKLIQLNRKFGFLQRARVVVDLCAAPGGWLQVCAQVLPVSGILVGVDLVPIKAIQSAITVVSDITTPECLSLLQSHLQSWKADLVLHDGAPNLGQDWSSDAFGQARLTLSAIKLAVELLAEGGGFVTKIFRSKDYPSIVKLLSSIFKHVHPTKPVASRRESAELFLVCQDFLGKAAVDAINFDPNQVFKFEVHKAPITLKKLVTSKKVNRGGYDDEACAFVYKEILLSEFLESDAPLEVLARTNSIINDVLVNGASSKNSGFKSLDMGDFKFSENLENNIENGDINKRKIDENINSLKDPENSKITTKLNQKTEKNLKALTNYQIDSESCLGNATEELNSNPASSNDVRINSRGHLSGSENIQNGTEIQSGNNIDEIHKKDIVFKYKLNTKVPNEIFEYFKDVRVLGIREVRALLSFRDKCRKFLNLKDDYDNKKSTIDNEVQNFTDKTGASAENEGKELSEADKEKAEISAAVDLERREDKKLMKQKRKMERIQKIKLKQAAKQCENAIDENEDSNLFSLKSLQNISQLNKLLKSNLVVEENDDEEPKLESEIDEKIEEISKKHKKKLSKNPLVVEAIRSESEESDAEIEADIEFLKKGTEKGLSKNKKAKIDKKAKKQERLERIKNKKFDKKFPKTEDDNEKEDENAVTNDQKAILKERKDLKPEELALAAYIKTSNKNKKQVIEESWNRYIRPPNEDLPPWFKDYEKAHIIRQLPITKEEVDFYRKKQHELDSQPIKKVLEARARQKYKKIKILEQTNARATKLLDNEGATDVEKMEQLKSIYKKANKLVKTRPKKKLIVAKKGLAAGKRYTKPKGIKGPVKIVDARMKKDKRNEQFARKSKHRTKSRMRNRR